MVNGYKADHQYLNDASAFIASRLIFFFWNFVVLDNG